MKFITQIATFLLVAFLCSYQASLLAQISGHDNNLWACKNGLKSCDRDTLSDAEAHDMAVSMHQRNLADCRSGTESCDRAQL